MLLGGEKSIDRLLRRVCISSVFLLLFGHVFALSVYLLGCWVVRVAHAESSPVSMSLHLSQVNVLVNSKSRKLSTAWENGDTKWK